MSKKPSLVDRGSRLMDSVLGRFLPSAPQDVDRLVRANLVAGFGVVGTWFGFCYSLFYAFIGHMYGALIVAVCTLMVAGIPFVMLRTGRVRLAGHLHAFTLTAGFTGLALLEGGMSGHAVAWLAAVPICALLLINRKAAVYWTLISLGAMAFFAAMELDGMKLSPVYPMRWHSWITVAGYVGLAAFMVILGFIFENGRREAQARMEKAMGDVSDANVTLQDLNREKNEFFELVAHDLRNPLTAILARAELILSVDKMETAEVQRNVIRLRQSGEQMRDLINNLLDIHRIESGQMELGREPLDLAMEVQQAVDGWQPVAEQKKIALRLELPGQAVNVRGDLRALRQIIGNLLSNAVKYSPRGKTVTVCVMKDGVMEVSDEGPGLSEEDQKSLFKKFVKLSARPTAGESSNGLGLSLCKGMADAMGGTLSCKSVLGEGAAFRLELPLFSSSA